MKPIYLFVSLFFLWQTPILATSDLALERADNAVQILKKNKKDKKSFKKWWKGLWKKTRGIEKKGPFAFSCKLESSINDLC